MKQAGNTYQNTSSVLSNSPFLQKRENRSFLSENNLPFFTPPAVQTKLAIDQQNTNTSLVQRSCGPAIGAPAGCIGSSADIFMPGVTSDRHFQFQVGCDEFLPGEEGRFISTIATMPLQNPVYVHGFASEEGNAVFNINLSCARARVAAALIRTHHPLGGSLNIIMFSHGATPGARDIHRAVVITDTPAPVPPPPPPPPPTRSRRTLLEQCQAQCVRRLGGCANTRPGGLPTPEEIQRYNAECSRETGYTGSDITPSADDCGNISIVEVIPDIMTANGWPHGALVLEEWFNNPSGGGAPDTSSITMDWILTFPEARAVYDSIFNEQVYANPAAQREICNLITRLGVPRGGSFDFSLPITTLDPPAPGTPNYSVNFRAVNAVGITTPLTDLSAALGNFIFKVLVAGNVDSSGMVTINRVGVYVKDSFDFDGEQALGCWNPCTSEVGRTMCGSAGVNVGNATFRDWRTAHGMGGDFMIYSDIVETPLSAPATFSCPP